MLWCKILSSRRLQIHIIIDKGSVCRRVSNWLLIWCMLTGSLVIVRIGSICRIIVIPIIVISITLESVVSKVRRRRRWRVTLKGRAVGRRVALIMSRSTKGLSISWSGRIGGCRPSMWGRYTARRIGKVPSGRDGLKSLNCSGKKDKPWPKDKPNMSTRDRPGTWINDSRPLRRPSKLKCIIDYIFCFYFLIWYYHFSCQSNRHIHQFSELLWYLQV